MGWFFISFLSPDESDQNGNLDQLGGKKKNCNWLQKLWTHYHGFSISTFFSSKMKRFFRNVWNRLLRWHRIQNRDLKSNRAKDPSPHLRHRRHPELDRHFFRSPTTTLTTEKWRRSATLLTSTSSSLLATQPVATELKWCAWRGKSFCSDAIVRFSFGSLCRTCSCSVSGRSEQIC